MSADQRVQRRAHSFKMRVNSQLLAHLLPAMDLYVLAVIALQIFILPSEAQSNPIPLDCQDAGDFLNYNASGNYAIPALRIKGSRSDDEYKIVEDTDSTWSLMPRLRDEGAGRVMTGYFLDTANSSLEDIGFCLTALETVAVNSELLFSRTVLERSTNDNGDCRTMLGEQCVEALRQHHAREAVSYMASRSCTDITLNQTLPFECRYLVNEDDHWNGNKYRIGE